MDESGSVAGPAPRVEERWKEEMSTDVEAQIAGNLWKIEKAVPRGHRMKRVRRRTAGEPCRR